METLPTTRKWTVEEYHQICDVGIISPDERVELVDGEILTIAAKKPIHVITTELIAKYLRELLRGVAHIQVQDPVVLSDLSEPKPDIAVVRPPLRRYFDRHPSSHEIFLIIEVADLTLRFDTKKKASMYAEAGIENYWVVDVRLSQVYIFQEPVDEIYTKTSVVKSDSICRLFVFPDIDIALVEFFT